MFLTQKKYLTHAGQKDFQFGNLLQTSRRSPSPLITNTRQKTFHIKAQSHDQSILVDLAAFSYKNIPQPIAPQMTIKLPDVSSFYKDDKEVMLSRTSNNKKGVYKFSCSTLFKSDQQIHDTIQKPVSPKLVTKARNHDQYAVDIISYMNHISKRNGGRQHLQTITKLCDELKPIELPTLNQLSLKLVEDKLVLKQAWKRRTKICAYFYDQIVNKQLLGFGSLIEMYMERHQIKRGILTMETGVFLKQFFEQLQLAQQLFNSDKLIANGISKTQGIDLKILKVLFQKQTNRLMDEFSILDIIQDPYFSDNFRFRYDLKKEDIIMRFLSGFDLPDDMYETLCSLVMRSKFNISDSSIVYRDNLNRQLQKEITHDFGTPSAIKENLGKLNFDVDFLKKLIYFQKNLEQTLQVHIIYRKQTRQTQLTSNLKSFLSQYQDKTHAKFHKGGELMKNAHKDLSDQLEQLEKRSGPYDHLSVKERFECKSITEQENIQLEVKQTLNFEYIQNSQF